MYIHVHMLYTERTKTHISTQDSAYPWLRWQLGNALATRSSFEGRPAMLKQRRLYERNADGRGGRFYSPVFAVDGRRVEG